MLLKAGLIGLEAKTTKNQPSPRLRKLWNKMPASFRSLKLAQPGVPGQERRGLRFPYRLG